MPVNNIIKQSDGRYRYRYTDATGKARELRSRKGEGRNAFARRCEETEQLGQTRLGSDITFGELFTSWQDQYQKSQCSMSDKRNMQYAYDNFVKPKIGHMKAKDVTKSDTLPILTDVVDRGFSASILSKVRQAISRPYNWAISILDMPLDNPVKGLTVTAHKKESDDIKIISDDEFAKFLDASKDTRYYYFYQLMWLTGLRPSEALGLQDKDIKGMSLQVRRGITKDGLSKLKTARAVRDIPITPQLKETLIKILDTREPNRAGWLFPLQHGRAPTMSALVSSFMRVRNRIGSGFTLYDFRHTFGTRMAEAGMSHKSLQIIMGHASIEVTMRYYVGFTPAARQAAMDIMSGTNVPSLSRLGFANMKQNEDDQTKKAQ